MKIEEILAHPNKEYVLIITEKDTEMCNFLKDLKPLEANRSIIPSKVNAIKVALAKKEYLPPIEVQIPAFGVMEGNHRLTAVQQCIEEGLPFVFRVHLYKSTEKIIDLTRMVNNTQKRWTAMDRLTSFVKEENGTGNYTAFLNFMEDNDDIFKKGKDSANYNVSIGLAAIANGRTLVSMGKAFQNGKLRIRPNDINVANIILQELRSMEEILTAAGVQDVSLFNRYAIKVWTEMRVNNNWPAFLKKFKKKAKEWINPVNSVKAWDYTFAKYFVRK